jgi:hypothetical protein
MPAPASPIKKKVELISLIGTRWVKDGVGYRLNAITMYGAMLCPEDGADAVFVQLYDWPGGFRQDKLDTPQPGKRVWRAMMVGGESGKWLGKLVKLASERRVDLHYHQPGYSRKYAEVPSDVEVLVLLVSHMGHGALSHYKQIVASRKIPLIMVQSRGFAQEIEDQMKRILGERYGADRYGLSDAALKIQGYWTFNVDTDSWDWIDLCGEEVPEPVVESVLTPQRTAPPSKNEPRGLAGALLAGLLAATGIGALAHLHGRKVR